MKTKNIKLSLIVLFALVIASFSFFATAQEQAITTKNIFLDNDQDGLSDAEEVTYGTDPQKADSDGDGYSDGAEVQSGYSPTNSSSNDKIITTDIETPLDTSLESGQKNLTQDVTQKIVAMISNSNSTDQDISLEQVQSLVDESLTAQISQDEFPVVTKDDILIKENDLHGLTKAQIEETKKSDLIDYLTGISYTLASNSPTPITSTSDITTLSSTLTQDFTTAVTSQNPQAIATFLETDQKILEQMKNIPVPEDLVDLHIEALRIAEYTQNLDTILAPNPNDPLASLANFSKLMSFIDYTSAFSDTVTAKIDSYGLTMDESITTKLSTYGMSDELIQKLSQ